MHLIFSIVINASIFFILGYIFTKYRPEGSIEIGKYVWQTYLVAGTILWVLNYTIKPMLQIIGIPFSLFFSWITRLVIHAIILWLISFIMERVLVFEWITFKIHGFLNFLIAVILFTVINMVYSILFRK